MALPRICDCVTMTLSSTKQAKSTAAGCCWLLCLWWSQYLSSVVHSGSSERPVRPVVARTTQQRSNTPTEREYHISLSAGGEERERMSSFTVVGVVPPHRPLCSYCITAAGLLGLTPLVDGRNAAKGSRQTGCAPSEDAVAPEAKSQGPVTCRRTKVLWSLWVTDARYASGAAAVPLKRTISHSLALDQGVCRVTSVAHTTTLVANAVAHLELLPCRGI